MLILLEEMKKIIYTFWWTINPPSSQCFDIDMIYQIYLLMKFTIPK